jgi:hypothetical protein
MGAVLILMVGCRGASGVSTTLVQDRDPVAFKRIAVMPFQGANAEDMATYARTTAIPASVLNVQSNPANPEGVVEGLFWERIVHQKKFDLVSPDRTGGIFQQITSISYKTTFPEAIARVGSELDADGLVVGYVYRYRERQGYDYSAEKPASVAFEIRLYRCRDGALVWKAAFDKTQTSLMEDMLRASSFIKDRGRWITARELASQGMDDVLKAFPGLVQAGH